MIIADTSIWIDFFRGKLEENQIFIELIESDEILMPDVVAGELLQGAKSEKEIKVIKNYAENLRKYSVPDLFIEAGEYSFRNKLIDKGIGLIDASIIITALRTNSKIWSLDKKLTNYLEEKYIYKPSFY